MNTTFAMIKPRSVENRHNGEILSMIENSGFEIIALKYTRLSPQEAAKFYEIHKERPFYKDLYTTMSKGPIIALVLKKENAVEEFRNLIGATNPEEAAEGTIRKKYGFSIDHNAIHGSDSDANAKIESNFFFTTREIYHIDNSNK